VRIATWNINSVTARLDRLLAWLESASPDVVALQELKCTSDAFPHLPIQALGYEAVAHGNGRWNGVALLSRVGLSDVTFDLDDQPRFDDVVETRATTTTRTSLSGSGPCSAPSPRSSPPAPPFRSRSSVTSTSPQRTPTSGTSHSSRTRRT
jgi:endonuclease/exonuclease/phosphatase family metal-dependent hydrolase